MSLVTSGKGRCPYCGKELDPTEAFLHIFTCHKRPKEVRVKYV
jgi:hypothetical protein